MRALSIRQPYGFVLSSVRPVPFEPCRGTLGFFDVPFDVLECRRCVHVHLELRGVESICPTCGGGTARIETKQS